MQSEKIPVSAAKDVLRPDETTHLLSHAAEAPFAQWDQA